MLSLSLSSFCFALSHSILNSSETKDTAFIQQGDITKATYNLLHLIMGNEKGASTSLFGAMKIFNLPINSFHSFLIKT